MVGRGRKVLKVKESEPHTHFVCPKEMVSVFVNVTLYTKKRLADGFMTFKNLPSSFSTQVLLIVTAHKVKTYSINTKIQGLRHLHLSKY